MPGTKEGAKKMVVTMRKKYGENHWRKAGRKGGKVTELDRYIKHKSEFYIKKKYKVKNGGYNGGFDQD